MAAADFSWVDFYKEFSNKLIEYKDDRALLIEKIIHAFQAMDMKLPTLETDGALPTDIDPFTVFGLFNKSMTDANRRCIAEGLASELGVEVALSGNFEAIPVLNPIHGTFYGFKGDRAESDIDNLWKLFAAAIEYADSPIESNRREFVETYDAVRSQYQIKWNITMALFWIRPFAFINLDSCNRDYVHVPGVVSEGSLLRLDKLLKRPPSGEEYLEIIEIITEEINDGSLKVSNLPDFSFTAWKVSKNKVKIVGKPPYPDYDEFDYSSILNGKQCWWLNANPSIWRFEDLKPDDYVNYTLYNENGNKRRIFKHFLEAKEGDFVIGYEGSPVKKIVAIGYVFKETDGEYLYCKFPYFLSSPIEYSWLKNAEELKEMEFIQQPTGSIFCVEEDEFNFLIGKIIELNPDFRDYLDSYSGDIECTPYTKKNFLEEVYIDEKQYEDIVSILDIKKNIILQGAPGVGKTYAAKKLAYSVMGEEDPSRVMLVQFHQSYSYEDFIMGYRPTSDGGFELSTGAFYDFCKKAEDDPYNDYFFIIDEINRGNLSRIFGELFMLIENDKRNQKVRLLYRDEMFSVPSNVYLIGMMNTADRSLAMLDYALRRRFAFIDLKPGFNSDGFKEYQDSIGSVEFDNLIKCVKELNQVIAEDDTLGEGFCIGHSYFCNLSEFLDEKDLAIIVDYELIPLLKEYWFDEPSKVEEWSERLRDSIK